MRNFRAMYKLIQETLAISKAHVLIGQYIILLRIVFIDLPFNTSSTWSVGTLSSYERLRIYLLVYNF